MREIFTILFLVFNLSLFAQNHQLNISNDAVQKDVSAIELIQKATFRSELIFEFTGDESQEKFTMKEISFDGQIQTIDFASEHSEVSFTFNENEFVEAKLVRNGKEHFISYDAVLGRFYYGEIIEISNQSTEQSLQKLYSLDNYNGTADNEKFIQIWGQEASRNITNSQTIERSYNVPIFNTSYDWHSSVNGHFATVSAGRLLNDAQLVQIATNQYKNSNEVSKEANNSSYKSTLDREKTYGYPWLLLLGAELKKNQPQAFNHLKKLLDSKYYSAKQAVGLNNGRVGLNSSYYDKSLTSGYKNYNFAFFGIYSYAEAVGDTDTMNAIKNYLNAYATNIDWGSKTSTDFFEGKAIAALLYQKVGLIHGMAWNNLSIAYENDSSTLPTDLSRFGGHSLGRFASAAWGYWAMYEITKETEYLNKFTQSINLVYQELKKRSSNSSYFNQEGHWIPHFGAYALALSQTRILPIELVSFEAEKNGEHAILSWSIAKAEENGQFVIEQSADGNQFTTVKTVLASQFLTYKEVLSLQAYTGDFVYFRLRAIDNNGEETLSNVQKVTLDTKMLQVYPTILNRGEQIHIVSEHEQPYQIVSMNGQAVAAGQLRLNHTSISTSEFLSGAYLLVIGNENVKIIIE